MSSVARFSREGRARLRPVRLGWFDQSVPTISVFYGIVIRMFVKDHPPPHFHVRYAEHRARIAIADGEPIDGALPPRAARMVREWAELHRDELEANWRRVEAMLPLEPIEPLP